MPRPRTAAMLLLAVLVPAPPAAWPQDDEPVFRNRKLSEWLKVLKEDASYDRRRAALLAAELVGPNKSTKVLPALTAALRDDTEERLREAAAVALGRLGERQGSRAPNDRVSFEAPREGLIAALRTDKSGKVRRAAAEALGRLEAVEAAPAVDVLAAALKDPDPATRTAAAESLRRIGADARDAVPALREALEDVAAPAATRVQAALALGNIGGPALPAVPELTAALAPANPPQVRRAAAATLGRLGKGAAEAAGPLGKVLVDRAGSDVELRRAAAAALDGLGPDAGAALKALQDALTDDDRFVRGLALHALGRMGAELASDRKSVVAAVLARLNDRVVEVRVAALETLGALGPDGLGPDLGLVVGRIGETSRDSQKAVRDAAQEALKKLRPMP